MEPRDKLSCWCLRVSTKNAVSTTLSARFKAMIHHYDCYDCCFWAEPGFQWYFFLAFPSKSVLNRRSCDIEISPNCQSSSTSNVQNPQPDASIEAVFFRWSNLRSSDCRMAKASTFDTSSDSEEDQEVQDFRNMYESAVILAVKDRQRKSRNNRFRIDA